MPRYFDPTSGAITFVGSPELNPDLVKGKVALPEAGTSGDFFSSPAGKTAVASRTPTVLTPDLRRTAIAEDLARLQEYNAAIANSQLAATAESQTKEGAGGGLTFEEAREVYGTDFSGLQQRDGQFFPDASAKARKEGMATEKTPEDIQAEFDKKADEELATTLSELDRLRKTFSSANQSLVESIQAQYAQRRTQLADVNKRSLASLQSLGIRTGASRYAPELQQGLLSSEERAGIMRLSELDAEEKSLIAQANLAATEKDFKLFSERMSEVSARRKEKQNVITEQAKRAFDENKKLLERKEKTGRRALLLSSVKAGIKDPFALAQQLQAAGYEVDFAEIEDALELFEGEKPETTSDITEFDFENKKREQLGLQPYKTLAEFKGAIAAAQRKPEEGKETTLPPEERRTLLGAGFEESDISLIETDVRDFGLEAVVSRPEVSDVQKRALRKAYGAERPKFLTREFLASAFGEEKLNEAAKELGLKDPLETKASARGDYLDYIMGYIQRLRDSGFSDEDIFKMIQ